VPSRTIEDLNPAMLQVMNFFPKAKVIYCDNEPSLKSHTITIMLASASRMRHPFTVSQTGKWNVFTFTLLELARK